MSWRQGTHKQADCLQWKASELRYNVDLNLPEQLILITIQLLFVCAKGYVVKPMLCFMINLVSSGNKQFPAPVLTNIRNVACTFIQW